MKILEALNEQVNFELESAYIYRNMASWFSDYEMPGMKHFFKKQEYEEIGHAEKIIALLEEMGHSVTYRPIDPGKKDWKKIVDVFKAALEHEKVVTKNIHKLYEQALKEDEKRVLSLLLHYIDEQVEEENNFTTLVNRLERIGDSWAGLYILDGELAHRE